MTFWRRGGRRLAAVLVTASVALLAGVAPASAHGELERSDPPNGGMVAVGRSTLTLWYSEPVMDDASRFELHTLDGVQIAADASVAVADEQGIVTLEVSPLAEATYQLDWTVLSAEDGHPSSGSLVFGVGTRPDLGAEAETGLPEGRGLFLRWLDLAAIMLVIGSMAVSGGVLAATGSAGQAPRRLARYIGALAAGLAVAFGVITPFVRMPHGGTSLGGWLDATWATLTGTSWGQLWLAREVALVVVAVACCVWAARPDRSRRWMQVALVALVAAVWFEALVGHAADLPRQSLVASLASAAHLGAAGVWAGGLTVLALCLLPLMRRDVDARAPMAVSAFRAFSPMAAVATVVLVATGLYESGRHVVDLHALTSTVYGSAVMAKVVLVVVALALAGFNTLLVNPILAGRVGQALHRPVGWAPLSLRRLSVLVVAEVVVLALAVGTAALLTSVPTARDIATATAATAPRSANVDGLFVTFEEVPAGDEESRLIVRTRSTVKPEPAQITGVDVLLTGDSGATELALVMIEPSRYEIETDALAPGDWQTSVVVHRDGVPDAVMDAEWTVAAPASDAAGALERVATTLALILLAALAAIAGIVRRSPKDPERQRPGDDAELVRQP